VNVEMIIGGDCQQPRLRFAQHSKVIDLPDLGDQGRYAVAHLAGQARVPVVADELGDRPGRGQRSTGLWSTASWS
jgi:hypothetical protein